MEETTSGLDPDELIPMDMDEPDGSDLEEEDEELEDPIPSPFLLSSSGPASAATSAASSPPNIDEPPPPFNFSGKPLNIKRGRGRPRREGGKPLQRTRGGASGISRVRKPRPPGFSRRGGGRSVRQLYDRTDFDYFPMNDDFGMDSDVFGERPLADEPPYFPEHWPGKVCALCNLGEKSQLGQGDMLRLNCPEGFSPQKVAAEQNIRSTSVPENNGGDKSPRGPVTCRRQKSFNKCRHPSATSEYIDELTLIGYTEVPDVSSLFEGNGQFYVHRSCALWSSGVTRADNSALQNVGPVVLQSSSRKCSFCSHYGASLTCKADDCSKVFHFSCATAAGAFQELASLTMFCSSHLGQVSMLTEASVCYTCKMMGDVANLMYCSSCGTHYHGTCVGLAQTPGVRAGWQCRKCKICQVCRMTGDESKLMSCEHCDKVYHASCQRPVVTAIPKYGWKCRCCRVCGDCGARTPGAGLSSRWHAHYTVCDSCYQQRNKGYSCPLCHRAYRAHAHREMVQCTMCRKFVHGTCDPEAELITYHQKKENNPDYEYVCVPCKNLTQAGRQVIGKRASIDDPGDLSASQESLYDDTSEFDLPSPDDFVRNFGMGKGKPYHTSKIAKKRLGFAAGLPGRPKGTGKALPGKLGFMKRAKMTDFGRKRGHKAKMRGVFGVPGVGLQRPVSDGKNDDEPGVENRLVLCSAKDKFILTQDICVMCGALGTDQEGCLISCLQCGQCYHPYCVNVKITKVILEKGWRCLDCTVCEGCGQRDDDARLILCDDCDVSYHIYCTRPPLMQVPTGTWRCSSCARCEQCGSTDPGFNCSWMGGWKECGPCASRIMCPACNEAYSEGELIIQCGQCERWLHGTCDLIKTEEEAERCAEEGYCCILCRPRDVPPPHLVPPPVPTTPKVPTTPTTLRSPPDSINRNNNNSSTAAATNYFVDGVYLSERGNSAIKAMAAEHQNGAKKKRRKLVGGPPAGVQDKEAGIMATIESVVAGSSSDNPLEDSAKLELVDVKDEPQELYKEGMIWTKEDGPPPEGFTVFAMESGVCVLRRKRQRNLQKLGIGGFLVRMRGFKNGQDNDDIDTLPGQMNSGEVPTTPSPMDGEKPRKKPIRRKPKSKLTETFPSYLQEAFFGKDLMDIECKKEVDSCSSDEEKSEKYKSINLSQDELMAVAAVTAKQEKMEIDTKDNIKDEKMQIVTPKEEEDDNTEDLKDVLALPGDLLDTDLVNSIINEDDDELTKNTESLGELDSNLPDDSELADTLGSSGNSKDTKDELSDILGPNFNLDSIHIPNINSKDVEDIFKGVLTDESQESQESNAFPLQGNNIFSNNTPQQQMQPQSIITTAPPVRPQSLLTNLNSPASFPPPSPYHSEYSNSPQFSPAFSEPPSPWVGVTGPNSGTPDNPDIDSTSSAPSTYNQRSSEKMRADEGLGNGATISAVLYANMNHPEWQTEFPNWSDRYKQIIKKWKTLSQDQRAPYLQNARDNRSQLRMKKAQQSQQTTQGTAIITAASSHKDTTSSSPSILHHHHHTTSPSSATPAAGHAKAPPSTLLQQVVPPPPLAANNQAGVITQSQLQPQQQLQLQQSEDQEKIAQQQKSAREAEQERQWKQLQALRQQQAQQQQHVIHEQRVQGSAIARVQRQMSSDLTQQQFLHDQQSTLTPLAPLTPQDQQQQSPVASPSPTSVRQQFLAGIKSPTSFSHHPGGGGGGIIMRSQTPAPDFSSTRPGSADNNDQQYQQQSSSSSNIGGGVKAAFQSLNAQQQGGGGMRQTGVVRQPLQGFTTPVRPDQPDITHQLRDLLQRQQFKKLDDLLPGKSQQQRVWPSPVEQQQQQDTETPTTTVVSSADTTFRQPLPPSVARPRIPVTIGGNRPLLNPNAMRINQGDPRIQGLDPRMRLIIQQQQRLVQQANAQGQIQQHFVRFSPGVRPTTVEQYEQLLQRQAQAQNQVRAEQQQLVASRLNTINQAAGVIQRQTIQQTAVANAAGQTASGSNDNNSGNEEGIPDNVTAELEKLEQETGTMVELQGVSDILGGLGEDDDELLAEMGADFNILEYADPELEALTGGKTNIFDLELEEEPVKKDSKEGQSTKQPTAAESHHQPLPAGLIKKETQQQVMGTPEGLAAALPAAPHPSPVTQMAINNQQQQPQPQNVVQHLATAAPQSQAPLPPATVQQAQAPPPNPPQLQHFTPQQIHQQMLHQVQQAAAQGRPMPPGSKMQAPDGIVGIVLPNNTVQLQIPQNYQHRLLLQLQNQQKLQMRLGQVNPRPMAVQASSSPVAQQARMGIVAPTPPPPPPPYPGPPPPYPGSTPQHQQQEQPLLLEDLLEQEKREQEKMHNQPTNAEVSSSTGVDGESSALLSDHDFERLKADVFNSGPVGINPGSSQGNIMQQTWQQQPQTQQSRPVPTPTPQPTTEITTRVQMFNANLIPAPPLPPENIVTEQDKQAQMMYEQWLNHQNNVLSQQLRFYETEVQKLRKNRKSLNSKQRQLRKSGNQLAEADATELQRITAEQAILQKHLESSRKQSRQHGMLIQEYRNKQQAKQQKPSPGQSPCLQSPLQQIQSPLGHPASSPMTSQSPLMSPSASQSPLAHHTSPMHSPGPIISPSPGPGSVQGILQSPGSLAGSSMSPMQPSPRIGTPHSQSEGSPGPVQSPSQICLPPPAPRMTSPQHRRVVTSPSAAPQMRFVNNTVLQQRVRMQSTMSGFQQQKPGTPSPLNSPTSQPMNIAQQIQLQKQLQQHALMQQQQVQVDSNNQVVVDPNMMHSPRAAQLIQHRNLIRQQQQQVAQQQQPLGQPQPLTPQQHQMMLQQQKQLAQQQQQQIARLQQQQQQQQVQQIQQNNQPHSPMPPKSPMVNQQIMSPHSMPPSPMQMPPKSPMVNTFNSNNNIQANPNSPAARSPAFHQGMNQPASPIMALNQCQPPSSPMPRSPMLNQIQSPHGIRRPPSANSSPANPERPHSVENPGTPRTPYSIDHLMQEGMQNQHTGNNQYNNETMHQQNNPTQFNDNMQSGGGNPNNPLNPIPLPPNFGRFGYFKLGLRGGSPMWSYGRGAKRIPTPPNTVAKSDEKPHQNSDATTAVNKIKKESHLSKVSILKRRSPAKTTVSSTSVVGKISSLVSTDYNDDDSSCTPPVTPPPSTASSSSRVGQKTIPKSDMVLHSPDDDKQLDMMDYDDDNTVLSAEVSLSSAAQQNDDEMVEMETLSQPDLAEGLSSPLESDQIPDEYLLFPGNMVVDMSGGTQYSDKDEEVEEEYAGENMHIVIRSPTTSDDEFIMQGKTKKYNIVPHSDILNIAETPESPEHEEITEPSPEPLEEEVLSNFDEHNIMIIDPNSKSPEDSISTKEDFEELIDKGSRKDINIKKREITTKHINEFHKYANIFSYTKSVQQSSSPSNTAIISNITTQKVPQKISLITSPVVQHLTTAKPTGGEKIILTQNSAKVLSTSQPTSKVTSIILTHNSSVRSNVLGVPKIVNTVAPAITIVGGSSSKIASILPSKFTVPVISASAVRQLSNVKVIDKPSSSISLTTHDSALPKKIFEDDSVSPDSSACEDDKSKDSSDEKSKIDSPTDEDMKAPTFIKKIPEPEHSTPPSGVKSSESPQMKHVKVTNLVTKDGQKQRVPSPVISKTSSPMIIHNTPELKMTAQVIQETQSHMQITATETVDTYDGSIDDTKSVVISIPSPTPSQEQMLDNIALQALENRRREFESFEDVLDMIENITAEPPAILEENVQVKEQTSSPMEVKKAEIKAPSPVEVPAPNKTEPVKVPAPSKSSVVPQLSPLSQPTELTTNMANASQQLRTLLSSLQTTSASIPTNVESVVKNIGQKNVSCSSPNATQPIVASRVIQQAGRQSPIVTNMNTVIVPNVKQQKPVVVSSSANPPRSSPIQTQTLPTSVATSTMNYLQNRSTSGMYLLSENPQPPASSTVAFSQQHTTTVITAQSTNVMQKQPVTSTNGETTRKPSLTLTAMLQNQPAATPTTKSTADSITAASLLGSPISLARTGFSTALVQAQPNAVVTPTLSSTSSPVQNPTSTSGSSTVQNYRPATSTTNLLHTQLTKVVRTKSQDEPKEIKVEENRQECTEAPPLTTEDNKSALINSLKQELTGCKFSSIPTPHNNRIEDSQNVLLKKLLQNTACASTQSPPPIQVAVSTVVAPTSSTENATKVSTPTLSSLLPTTVIKTEPQVAVATQPQQQQQHPPKPNFSKMQIRETSFVSSPITQPTSSQQANLTPTTTATQQLHIDVKKCLPPSRTPSRDDLLSPQTPKSTCSQDSSLQTPPLSIKKEMLPLPTHQPSPVLTPHEVKKEFLDESSQHSTVSDHSRPDIPLKEELIEHMDTSTEKAILDKEELKKQKRRMYQQKRRQNQILNKELAGQQPKKRPRKNSKLDEDYDSYIDGVLSQLRQLPPMTVSEPVLSRNYGVMPVFGSGDMSKLGTKSYSSQYGDLTGKYGDAELPGYTDFYSSKPYGELEPLPEKPPASTQRGFYDQEFPLIRFDTDEDKKLDLFCRDDTPDSIVSSSSPECWQKEPLHKFMGLKLISEDDDDDEEEEKMGIKKFDGRLSPVVPMIKPIPIRLKPAGGMYLKDYSDNKENINMDIQTKTKLDSSKPSTPVKDSGNVTVTLTLTSSAAEDIMGVLRDLANILHIPAPTSYQIVERTTTPPSQKLGLYRTKGKDGKEGAPIDIQSILNGEAKFCKHCDVVILNNMIKKKVSDFTFLAKDSELMSEGEELYFCSTTCYTQFALMHRSPSVTDDKAAAIIDHLSQKDNLDLKQKKPLLESFDNKTSLIAQRLTIDNNEIKKTFDPMDTSSFSSYFQAETKNKYQEPPELKPVVPTKVFKNVRYKLWAPGCLQPTQKHKKPTDKELMELLYRMQITVTPPKMPEDTRKCMFCQGIGDSVADGPARLLNFDVDKWVHLNCALWSDGVYETVNGALMNLENALQTSLTTTCIHCNKLGATIRCFKTRCSNVYHLSCAVKDKCVFYKNKTVYCTTHVQKNEKDNELTTLSVWRRVYVNRDENRQVAAVMHHSDTNNLLRVGSLIFLNVGQLLPHQLQNFHTPNYIYPIGYKIIRFFWSLRRLNKRCRYICSIHDVCGKPEFRILIQEQSEEDLELKDITPKAVWQKILDQAATLRRENQCLQMFPKYTTGEDLFGLTEPAIVRVLESLPGIETLSDYKFKYGRNPLLELPLAINPSGAARTEPRMRNQLHWKRPHTQRTTGASVRPLFGPTTSGGNSSSITLGEMSCPYSKQFVHSKSSQYKKMKQEWRNNVYLARSKIQGLGLYAARDLEKHTMVIEYIGEIIRTELAECREKQYEAKNRGIYMFRLDEERVVDATLSGGLARYINHSCNPNCVAETVEVERDVRIIIFAKRRIQRGEELSYDYKFDIEDDQHKISCMCGAPNCRKWMN